MRAGAMVEHMAKLAEFLFLIYIYFFLLARHGYASGGPFLGFFAPPVITGRGLDVTVPGQFLDRHHIIAILKQGGNKGAAEIVGAKT
jgi:hypothetical protein